jgi:hypothetical protein
MSSPSGGPEPAELTTQTRGDPRATWKCPGTVREHHDGMPRKGDRAVFWLRCTIRTVARRRVEVEAPVSTCRARQERCRVECPRGASSFDASGRAVTVRRPQSSKLTAARPCSSIYTERAFAGKTPGLAHAVARRCHSGIAAWFCSAALRLSSLIPSSPRRRPGAAEGRSWRMGSQAVLGRNLPEPGGPFPGGPQRIRRARLPGRIDRRGRRRNAVHHPARL